MNNRGAYHQVHRLPVRHDVRLAMRCAMFVWFVLLGAALAEWQSLRIIDSDQRQAQSLRPSGAPVDSATALLQKA